MGSFNDFGAFLRDVRQQSKKTLKDLADYLGWSIVYLSDIERGKRNPPSSADIMKIALFLKSEPAALLDKANRQRNRVELNIEQTDGPVADAALMLARKWTDLTEEEARDIMAVLERRQET
ncbi:helix-turn-helix domain-containing protein [Nitratidesulfovibrio liaohensis]|uniref:helix-turn-helix domain-containing protein n=1 Tax=Nitratidesulfovibrio liaohensis TaxID=2604158 RepID=UPI00142335C6|nr:helix-turn-helix transcriptional regulator [Nitratidesulfovibrio liaohensis]NHZ47363.1 helix-turn-helix transcriptional regulator [Nitratidesulfovibrio liaohensis]